MHISFSLTTAPTGNFLRRFSMASSSFFSCPALITPCLIIFARSPSLLSSRTWGSSIVGWRSVWTEGVEACSCTAGVIAIAMRPSAEKVDTALEPGLELSVDWAFSSLVTTSVLSSGNGIA